MVNIMPFYTERITLYRKTWRTNDIIAYMESEDYKTLKETVHGKAVIKTKIKFAWFPIRLRNKNFLWLKNYVERTLEYLNVRGRERLTMQEYTLLKIKGTHENI